MTIIINKKEAVLKKGTSFDFIMENRFFTGADSYTLSITFPLKGCARNIDIFGHIYRKDSNLDKLLLECEIHDANFHKYGSVSIVEISELEVKTQFLEGRSERNYYSSFDDIYINQIPMWNVHDFAHWSADYYMRSYDKIKEDSEEDGIGEYEGYVCLPWVNNTTGNMQNKLTAQTTPGIYYYTEGSRDYDASIVGMPYLLNVLKKIFKYFGFTYDFRALERTQWRHIIICNVLPMVWQIRNFQSVLPHWTVTEFLEQVELFLNGEFHIDEKGKSVWFSLNSQTFDQMNTVVISNVVEEHQVEISSEEQSTNDNYIEQKNLAYAECSHQMWKYYSCDWAIGQLPKVSWTNIAAMQSGLASYMDCAGPYNHRYYNSLHVCRAESSYYVLKCYRTQTINKVIHHYMRLQPVNMFGQKIVNRSEDAQVEELRIVPVCIDHTDMTRGDVIFMECGTLGDDTEDAEDKDENQTQAVNTISAGEKEKKEEFFDKIYVGFWDGNLRRTWPQMPIPIIDPYMMDQFNLLIQAHYSMRLTGAEKPETRTNNYHIDQSVKFTFKFLVKDGAIPDVRSIFYIHGKKYMAEKITATFSAETGMSQLLKMVCYRVL
ncbi:hypothetical protein CIK92_09300 [Prevotella sp. P4-67]|uniref:hypothetical protein n=1 Tax=Prevotella sp. P4-67 TaxID=2024227 RepID=UPI000B97A927|nr:hypothetical protein [Prevotella sp. P4-67]OYP70669.1 hypothetical protein CIK92_09300 [Prevotella sp. P4-67]